MSFVAPTVGAVVKFYQVPGDSTIGGQTAHTAVVTRVDEYFAAEHMIDLEIKRSASVVVKRERIMHLRARGREAGTCWWDWPS